MAASIGDRISAADRVALDLFDLLESLPAEEWARPSDCAGWMVSDLAAHLVLVEALLGGSVSRGLQGDSGPPPQALSGPSAWMEYRTRRIAELATLPPAELVSQLRGGREQLLAAFNQLAGGAETSGSGWHPRGAFPLGWFPGQWLVEISLHAWDLRAPVEHDAEIHPAARSGLVDEMRARLGFCFRPDRAGQLHGVVRIDCGQDGAWLIQVADGQANAHDDWTLPVDATISTDGGTYALVQTGRRPATEFVAKGRWVVQGDTALVDRLLACFGGF